MQFNQLKRREFISLLGGAALAWPLAARAQQQERRLRIGILMNFAADDPAGQARLTAFLQGLQQVGGTDGRNVHIDIRWGAGAAERIRKFAAKLVSIAPDVILTSGSPTLGRLLQATRTIPIVFVQVACGRRQIERDRGGAEAVGAVIAQRPRRHGRRDELPAQDRPVTAIATRITRALSSRAMAFSTDGSSSTNVMPADRRRSCLVVAAERAVA